MKDRPKHHEQMIKFRDEYRHVSETDHAPLPRHIEPVLQTGDVGRAEPQQGPLAVGDQVDLVLGVDHLLGVGVLQQLVGGVLQSQHLRLVPLQLASQLL